MLRHIRYIILCMAGAMAMACSCSRTPMVTDSEPVIRLDKLMQAFPTLSPAAQADTLERLRPELDAMFAVASRQAPDIDDMLAWAASDVVRVFQPAVDSVYPNVDALQRQIGHMLSVARRDSLGLPSLTFATVTWGNRRPIARVDTIVLIALNHYLGADYPGYSQWPQYRRRDKAPESLPYDLAGALAATQHPKADAPNATLLSWMLYEGALVEARMRMVDGAKLHLALGMTADELATAESQCSQIWQEMAVNRLIYDTDPLTISRYIEAAPNTPLLSGQAPGRIGRYIGYRIVRAYMARHKDTSLAWLLSEDFCDNAQSLVDSGFNGR